MPTDLYLRENIIRIRREATLGDGGTATGTDVLRARLNSSTVNRDIAGLQERATPYRKREFTDVVHQAWEIELRGSLRTGGFLPWILEALTTAGTAERGLRNLELFHEEDAITTFAIQAEGIDGTTTFLGAAPTRLTFEFKGRRVIGWTAIFPALVRRTDIDTWTTDQEETGSLLTTSQARLSLASTLQADPADDEVVGYEGAVELSRSELEPAGFNADGIPQGFTRAGSWDVTGRLLVPELAIITSGATGSTWNGEINLAAIGDSTTLELEIPVTALIERRTLLDDDWKQCQVDFLARDEVGDPLLRIFTDQPTF